MINKYVAITLNTDTSYINNYVADGFQFRNTINPSVKSQLEAYRYAGKCQKYIRGIAQNLLEVNSQGKNYGDVICSYDYFASTLENEFKTNFYNEKYFGLGFPMTISKNDVLGHGFITIDDQRDITKDGVYKIDIGTNCNGYMVDSAFTVSYLVDNPLLEITKEALYTTLDKVGVDVRFTELSDNIEEIVTSYDGYQPVRNTYGHEIYRYTISDSNIISNGNGYIVFPDLYPNYESKRIEDGKCYTIEPFVTTGNGSHPYVNSDPDGERYGYILTKVPFSLTYSEYNALSSIEKNVYNIIIQKFISLPFSIRTISWYTSYTQNELKTALLNLETQNIIIHVEEVKGDYAPNVYVSQFEHTFYVSENGVEVFSRGDDY